jgi:hypothetical protein
VDALIEGELQLYLFTDFISRLAFAIIGAALAIGSAAGTLRQTADLAIDIREVYE